MAIGGRCYVLEKCEAFSLLFQCVTRFQRARWFQNPPIKERTDPSQSWQSLPTTKRAGKRRSTAGKAADRFSCVSLAYVIDAVASATKSAAGRMRCFRRRAAVGSTRGFSRIPTICRAARSARVRAGNDRPLVKQRRGLIGQSCVEAHDSLHEGILFYELDTQRPDLTCSHVSSASTPTRSTERSAFPTFTAATASRRAAGVTQPKSANIGSAKI
jgi:hypothetical protein